MSVLQRKRGALTATIYRTVTHETNRGERRKVADTANPWVVKVWVSPQRSSKAEVPGQQHINIMRIGVQADLAGVELYSRVELLGTTWDIVTPPEYHHGTRHTRHWTMDLRERPS